MSATIYEKESNGLYSTGQRSVSTFPSGLVRVDQTLVCRNTAAASHRSSLAVGTAMPGGSYPAIDGLKIFPEPQEKQRGDGFTEFIVSAYGRVSMTGIENKNKKLSTIFGLRYSSDSISYNHTFTQENPAIYPNYPSNIQFLETSVDSSVRIQRYENSMIEVQSGNQDNPTITRYMNSLMFVVYRYGLYYLLGGSLFSEMKSYQENNFGFFKEATISFEANDLEILTLSLREMKAL
jgi:hypothetical protein